jgi:hypothetical protein
VQVTDGVIGLAETRLTLAIAQAASGPCRIYPKRLAAASFTAGSEKDSAVSRSEKAIGCGAFNDGIVNASVREWLCQHQYAGNSRN